MRWDIPEVAPLHSFGVCGRFTDGTNEFFAELDSIDHLSMPEEFLERNHEAAKSDAHLEIKLNAPENAIGYVLSGGFPLDGRMYFRVEYLVDEL